MKKNIFLVIGIAFFVFGTWLAILNMLSDKSGLRTAATVVDCRVLDEPHPKKEDKQKKYYYPTLEFKDAGGRLHTKSFIKTTTAYAKGQSLNIIYNPNRPSDVTIESFWSSWWLALSFIALGIGTVFYGFKST